MDASDLIKTLQKALARRVPSTYASCFSSLRSSVYITGSTLTINGGQYMV